MFRSRPTSPWRLPLLAGSQSLEEAQGRCPCGDGVWPVSIFFPSLRRNGLIQSLSSIHHRETERNNFDLATRNMLGPRSKRTPNSTAFEDTHCVRKIRGKRCYSVGTAIQQSRRVVAPSASLDQQHANIDQYKKMVNDLVDVRAFIYSFSLHSSPVHCGASSLPRR